MDADELQASLAHWRTWVGRTETREDLVTAAPLAGLAATLDRDEPLPQPAEEIPPLAHWLNKPRSCSKHYRHAGANWNNTP